MGVNYCFPSPTVVSHKNLSAFFPCNATHVKTLQALFWGVERWVRCLFAKPGHLCTSFLTGNSNTMATAPRGELVQTRPSELHGQEGTKYPLHITCPINKNHINISSFSSDIQNSTRHQHTLTSF